MPLAGRFGPGRKQFAQPSMTPVRLYTLRTLARLGNDADVGCGPVPVLGASDPIPQEPRRLLPRIHRVFVAFSDNRRRSAIPSTAARYPPPDREAVRAIGEFSAALPSVARRRPPQEHVNVARQRSNRGHIQRTGARPLRRHRKFRRLGALRAAQTPT